MKQIVLFATAVASCLSSVACGGGEESGGENPNRSEVGGAGGASEGTGGREETGECTHLGIVQDDVTVGGCVIIDSRTVYHHKLTILPGTTVLMTRGSYLDMSLGSTLIARGTAEEPIVFTSIEESPRPGDWGCLLLEGRHESELAHVTFEYGGGVCNANGAYHSASLVVDTSLRVFEDITVRRSAGHGMKILEGAHGTRDLARLHFSDIEYTSLRVAPEGMNALRPPITLDDDDTFIDVETALVVDIDKRTTWRNVGLPYRFDKGVVIWDALTIEPGVVLQVNGLFNVRHDGSLHARGTAEEPIVWTSPKDDPRPGDWTGLWFSSNKESFLTHNRIEYAGHSLSDARAAVSVDSPVTFEALSFAHLDKPAISAAAKCPPGDEEATEWCGFSYENVPDRVLCERDVPFCPAR